MLALNLEGSRLKGATLGSNGEQLSLTKAFNQTRTSKTFEFSEFAKDLKEQENRSDAVTPSSFSAWKSNCLNEPTKEQTTDEVKEAPVVKDLVLFLP